MGISINMPDEIFDERARYLGNMDELMLEMYGEYSNTGGDFMLESPFSFGFIESAGYFQKENSTD